MNRSIHDLLSIDSLTLALHALAKLRKDTSDKLDAGDYEDEEFEHQSDRVLRLTVALNEFAAIYEPMRKEEANAPSIEAILKRYE